MPKVDEHLPATFSWTDLSTSDYQGAKRFYSGLFGWEVEDLDAGNGGVYGIARLSGNRVAGLGPIQEEAPGRSMQSGWKAYVTVESADEVADRVREVGGKVIATPFDVFDIGRLNVIQDPTGAVVCFWEQRGMPGAEVLHEPGAFTWAELTTNDAAKAADFYTKVFGWKAMKWDGETDYTVCKCGDDDVCGMLEMRPSSQGMSPNWMVYFAVADADDVAARAKDLGGEIVNPPSDYAGVRRGAALADPQGGVFSVIQRADGRVDGLI